MKKLLRPLSTTFCVSTLALAVAFVSPASAQNYVAAKSYPLTNGTTLAVNTPVLLAAGASSNVTSSSFPVVRGRGFDLLVTATNVPAFTFTGYFDVSDDNSNWTSSHPVAASVTMLGGVVSRGAVLVPPTTLDNVTYARLAMVSNSAATGCTVLTGSTNTFASVIP